MSTNTIPTAEALNVSVSDVAVVADPFAGTPLQTEAEVSAKPTEQLRGVEAYARFKQPQVSKETISVIVEKVDAPEAVLPEPIPAVPAVPQQVALKPLEVGGESGDVVKNVIRSRQPGAVAAVAERAAKENPPAPTPAKPIVPPSSASAPVVPARQQKSEEIPVTRAVYQKALDDIARLNTELVAKKAMSSGPTDPTIQAKLQELKDARIALGGKDGDGKTLIVLLDQMLEEMREECKTSKTAHLTAVNLAVTKQTALEAETKEKNAALKEIVEIHKVLERPDDYQGTVAQLTALQMASLKKERAKTIVVRGRSGWGAVAVILLLALLVGYVLPHSSGSTEPAAPVGTSSPAEEQSIRDLLQKNRELRDRLKK